MSTTVDNRVVEMQFENSQFEKGVRESLKTLEDLKKGLELDKATKNARRKQKYFNLIVILLIFCIFAFSKYHVKTRSMYYPRGGQRHPRAFLLWICSSNV